MSCSSGTAAKSLTAGRGGGVAVAVPGVGDVPAGGCIDEPCEGPCACVPGCACWLPGVVLAVPVGAGAAAWVVAGRLAQPLPTTATTSSDATTRKKPRLTMTPP